eukprot:364557-Chlamydomonas_euryale.AAC.36
MPEASESRMQLERLRVAVQPSSWTGTSHHCPKHSLVKLPGSVCGMLPVVAAAAACGGHGCCLWWPGLLPVVARDVACGQQRSS